MLACSAGKGRQCSVCTYNVHGKVVNAINAFVSSQCSVCMHVCVCVRNNNNYQYINFVYGWMCGVSV